MCCASMNHSSITHMDTAARGSIPTNGFGLFSLMGTKIDCSSGAHESLVEFK